MAVAEVIEMRPEPELERAALSWPEQARQIHIVDQASYDLAANKLLNLAEMRSEIVAHHAEAKQRAHEAHRAICSAEKRLLDPVAEAEQILRRGIGSYDAEQRRIREEAERKAREEAERIALEQRERDIEEAEAAGADVQEVAAIAAAPIIAPRVAVPAAATHRPVSGVSTAQTYRARVTDIRKLCQAVADGAVPHTLVLPNESALNAMARSLKGVMMVPGVVVEADTVVRAGRRQ